MSDLLRELLGKLNKLKPTSVEDINSQYDYEDTKGGGKRDASLVSCGQCTNYNELQYIYDEKLEPFIKSKTITKDQALSALNNCCAELTNPRKRVDFYKLLSGKLGVVIE